MRTALALGLVTLLLGAPSGADPQRSEQYGLDLLHFPAATDLATGEDTVIAIVDSGVDQDHPDLVGHLDPGADFVDGDDNPDDPNGHGTHVAGIAAAVTSNGEGVSGAAPDAHILPVRVLDAAGDGDHQTVAQGVDWAVAHDADVVNLSLGGQGLAARVFKNGPLNRAVRNAAARGVVVVVAAGNEATFERAYRPAVPVIVVNAVDQDAQPAEFSTFGDSRALASPGVGILSTAPIGPTTIWPEGTSGYERLDGTSQAAPFVAGVAALLAGQGLSVDEVRQVLSDTTASPRGDPRLGEGLVDADAAVREGARLHPTGGSSDSGGRDGDDPGVAPWAIPLAVVAGAVGVPVLGFAAVRKRA